MKRLLTRRRFNVALTALGAFAATLPLGAVRAGEAKTGNNPTVIELFTSEGCWSCPPAEARLAEIADRPDVLALAYHVDYWDYIGWEDPFATPEFTRRQRQYARHFDSRTVYTPQMVFQGVSHAPGSRYGEVEREMNDVANLERIRVDVAASGNGGMRVTLPSTPNAPDSQVLLALYDVVQTSDVLRGENAGKTLTHRNVVRRLIPLARWSGEARTIDAALPSDRTSERMGCAVLVQAEDSWRILGAGALELPTHTAS